MNKHRSIRFYAVEKLTFIYVLITAIVIFFIRPSFEVMEDLLRARLLIILGILSLAYLSSLKNLKILRFTRLSFVGGMLIYFYPETFEINRMLPNQDHLLAELEQFIFGYQPALVFREYFNQAWISELLNMGYFAYYPFIIVTSFYLYYKNKRNFQPFIFIVLFAFLTYYLIYILFPAAGPQFYFQVIGLENAHAGNFPNIGMYFKTNYVDLIKQDHTGFFSQMVQDTQKVGEQPTAAFPSSHVGISTLIMMLVYKYKEYILLAILSVFYFFLVLATVYIQAHYLIDVFAGFITAVAFYYLGSYVYELFTRKFDGIPESIALFMKPSKIPNI